MMSEKTKSVLVIGFNTRPLAQSLYNAGHEVYTVDFFGDLDLYPYVKDSIVIIKKLNINYNYIKDNYGTYLAKFCIDLLKKYPHIDYLIIGSGLDDDYGERDLILKEISKKEYHILNLNNDLKSIKQARDIFYIYNILKANGYKVPYTLSFDQYDPFKRKIDFPYILKRKTGSGGINVYKIKNDSELTSLIQLQKARNLKNFNWLIQEYIEGIPMSCTTISNGKECEIISINQQVIGEKFLNSPKEFMYCGNVVPANLNNEENQLISQLSKTLVVKFKLKGINGLDFVLKDHYPYFMEINPRIPGSISASEAALDINLLKLHIDSFNNSKWEEVKHTVVGSKPKYYATKLIYFAPKDLDKNILEKINKLEYLHDKTEPNLGVLKNAPLCTVLCKGNSFSESYFNALKIIDKINAIIS